MQEIMKFPEVKICRRLNGCTAKQRDGYKLEKWEFYPLSQCIHLFSPDTRFFTAACSRHSMYPRFVVVKKGWRENRELLRN